MDKEQNKKDELCRIEKRAIEAAAIAPVIEALALEIGKEKTLAILQDVNRREAFQRGESIRKERGTTSIADLVADVATWGKGALSF